MQSKKVTRVVFVLDRSGSMQPVMRQAIKAVNSNIETIRAAVNESGQDATVSLITFSDYAKIHFFNRSISAVDPISEDSLHTHTEGMTALFDATGEAIQQLLNVTVGTDEDVTYLVNVVTDGEENRSYKFTSTSLKQLMKKVQSTDLWTLTFLVPPGYRHSLIQTFSIPDGNVMEWEHSSRGVSTYSAASQAGLRNYFTARATGAKSTSTFYTDAANISLKDVKNSLDDITSKVRILKVKQESSIKDFIESTGRVFVKGCAFYELVPGKKKADKVQNYKQVMVVSKANGKVYSGDAARQMLGLPTYETKVRPGDNGDFDLFVQSTSTNRKLAAGTRVIYVK
jgi:uncharacterized protein YegL